MAVLTESQRSDQAVGYIDCQPGSSGNFVWKFRGKERVASGTTWASKPRDLYLELSDRSEIWQAPRQHCCQCACQISKQSDNSNYQSRVFDTSRDLMIRRPIGYWNVALVDSETFKGYLVHIAKLPKIGGSSHPRVETFSVSKISTLSQDHTFVSRKWMLLPAQSNISNVNFTTKIYLANNTGMETTLQQIN